jgi:YHS domain-containing protein
LTVEHDGGDRWHDDMENNMMIDPVCKMKVEPDKAAAKAEHAGQVYYFCSDICHKSFVAEPDKYTSGAAPADHACCGGPK